MSGGNIYFPLVDNDSNPLTGSKVTLVPLNAPYFSGPYANLTGSSCKPTSTISDANGVAWFYNVVPGTYQFNFTSNDFGNPLVYQDFGVTIQYISVTDTSGSIVNGWTFSIPSSN
jgi:hypothetical protein